MNKKEVLEEFEKNVDYLKRNVPPDDIYMFAEQTFMAAVFFLHKWNEVEDVFAKRKEDEVIRKWVNNIMGLKMMRDKGLDIQLDLNVPFEDED